MVTHCHGKSMADAIFEQSWQRAAREKAQDTKNKIPPEWRLDETVLNRAQNTVNIADTFISDLLGPEERDITTLHSVQLVEKLARRDVSAEIVTLAFCKRAAFAHQLVCS